MLQEARPAFAILVELFVLRVHQVVWKQSCPLYYLVIQFQPHRAGVLFNVLFPEWLQTALLVILLGVVIRKTAGKGIKQWQQEQKAKALEAEVCTHLPGTEYAVDNICVVHGGVLSNRGSHVKPHCHIAWVLYAGQVSGMSLHASARYLLSSSLQRLKGCLSSLASRPCSVILECGISTRSIDALQHLSERAGVDQELAALH